MTTLTKARVRVLITVGTVTITKKHTSQFTITPFEIYVNIVCADILIAFVLLYMILIAIVLLVVEDVKNSLQQSNKLQNMMIRELILHHVVFFVF